MTRILLLYAVSGFVSLGYQVAWFRIFTGWFGSTNFTFALVVANFIGGLAAGSLASRSATRLLTRGSGGGTGLRLYGAVELVVSASIGLTFLAGLLPADLWGSFPYAERSGIWVHTLGYRLFQGSVAAACVFVPCFFMGVTFPLLCDRFAGHPRGPRFPAALYAWNTLGACSGVLACQFVFLPRLGHAATLWLMAGTNALLGGYCLLTRADFGVGSVRASPPSRDAAPAVAPPVALLALVALGGFLSGALEADLFKRITFVIELNPGATMSFVSFWAVLAIFLASTAVHRAPALRLPLIRIAFVLAAVYCAWTWHAIDAIRDFVEASVLPVPVAIAANLEGFRNLAFPSNLVQLWIFVGILVFPPYFLVSLLLPWACNRLQGERRHLGLAYGLNTFAFCVGFLGFMLVAPRVNVFYASKLFSTLFLVSAAWICWVPTTRPLPAWKPLTLLAGLGAAALLAPADFDRSYFLPGTPPAQNPVRAVRSDGANTTFVVDVFGMPRLFFGRLQMSASNLRARTYMRLMAHFPLLLHPDPQKALLICLGVGNTGSAIASHPGIRQIDVVDLNEQVFATAPDLAAVNGNLHLDPRVRFIHDDGRSFLNLTHEKYDLITSEPPPPLAAGVYRLYSREYYTTVLEHLTPRGFMTQWLPLFLMTPESVAMAVHTFTEVFPHTLLFTGFDTDFILVGSPAPIDASGLERRLRESPAVAADLATFNIQSAASLLARVVQSDGALRRNYAGAGTISDQRNDLEHAFLDPRRRAVVTTDPADLRTAFAVSPPALRAELDGILSHLGRLRFHVQGYPFETLASIDPSADVALARTDWMRLADLYQELRTEQRADSGGVPIAILERFLDVEREQPEILFQLALAYLQRGDAARAIPLLREFLALEPDYYAGRVALANAYRTTGQARSALEEYAVAAQLQPRAAEPLAGQAWARATAADPDTRDSRLAVELALRADALAGGRNLSVRETLAIAYDADGRPDLAAGVLQAALDELPDDRRRDRRRLQRQLRQVRERVLEN